MRALHAEATRLLLGAAPTIIDTNTLNGDSHVSSLNLYLPAILTPPPAGIAFKGNKFGVKEAATTITTKYLNVLSPNPYLLCPYNSVTTPPTACIAFKGSTFGGGGRQHHHQ
jgi:hypothetical protein